MEQHIERYTKYIHEMVHKLDIYTATYKEHLHKVFEWYGCIELSRQSGTVVLRWEDVPADMREEKNMSRDMGIDAWDMVGDRVIQMKLYNGCIGWSSFSTFWSACFTSFEDSTKILYRNTESKLHSLIQANIQKGKLQDITVTDAVFRSACKKIQKQKIRITSPSADGIVIRPYQQEAMAMMEKAKDEGKNILVCLPTGTGKTTITLQYHLVHREPMLILVPTLVLMEQWKRECDRVGVEAYLIGTNQYRNLDGYRDQSVVICVYDSFGNITGEVERFGRIVVDEAHHVLVPERYMETEQEFDTISVEEDEEEDEGEEEEEEEDKKEEKPTSYMSHIRALSGTKRVVYLSATMDKPEDGSLFYEYKVRQAIQDGYLCDYQFVFPIFEQEYETNQHLAEYLVYRQQETHCLIYASNRAEGKEFVDRLNKLQPGCAGYVDGTTRPSSRKKIFADFESGKLRFLVNIRVLVEGFDAPHIRSIFFLRVSSNDIFIIQAIGRALRLHADKIKATVYVPFTYEGDIDRIQAFLTQLASYDERVGESIMGKRVGGYLRVERGEAEAEGEGEDGEEKGDEKEEVFEFRYNLVVDRMGSDSRGQLEAMALRRAEEYIAWVGEKGRRPQQLSISKRKGGAINEKEYKLAIWMSRVKMAKRGNINYKRYISVENRLIEALGDKIFYNLEQRQFERAQTYIQWYKKNGNKHAVQILCRKKINDAKPEQKIERNLATWMSNMKNSKKEKYRRRIYPSLEKLLIDVFGVEWWKKNDLEENQNDECDKYFEWKQKNNRNPVLCLDSKINKENRNGAQLEEHKVARWLHNMKSIKRSPDKTSTSGAKLYLSVENRLIELLGEVWWKKEDLEKIQNEQLDEYFRWIEQHNRKPSKCLNSKTRKDREYATTEQKKEQSLATWVCHIKDAKQGKGRQRLYSSIEERLIEKFGEKWWEKENLEEKQLEHANEYITWVREKSRHPKQRLQSKCDRENASEEDLTERRLTIWMCNLKRSIRGNNLDILYPSLSERLIEAFGTAWHTIRKPHK